MRVGRSKGECAVVVTSAATRTTHGTSSRKVVFTNIYTYYVCAVRQILVARTFLFVRGHLEEQPLDAAIVPVAGSFLCRAQQRSHAGSPMGS